MLLLATQQVSDALVRIPALVDDAVNYPTLHYNMIRIYAITEHDKSALDMIKEHLNIPSPFTLAFLKLDPDTGHLLADPGSPTN